MNCPVAGFENITFTAAEENSDVSATFLLMVINSSNQCLQDSCSGKKKLMLSSR